jgi:hypothetical protein
MLEKWLNQFIGGFYMMLRKFTALLVVTGSFISCGMLTDDANKKKKTQRAPLENKTFDLTGAVTTPLEVAGVTTFVKRSPLLAHFAINNGKLSVTLDPSGIQTGLAAQFSNCVKNKLDNIALAVTADSISFNAQFDFTAECDRIPLPEDHIAKISNSFEAFFELSCAGQDFSSYIGKTFKDLSTTAICANSSAVQLQFHSLAKAVKSTETKVGDVYAVTNVTSEITAQETSGTPNGGPCRQVVTDNKHSVLQSCVQIKQSRTFNGAPKFESNSPAEKTDAHPVVIQSIITLSNMTQERDGAPYYTSGTTTFQINGWNGTVAYTNGWAEPKWEAKLGQQSVHGNIGATQP